MPRLLPFVLIVSLAFAAGTIASHPTAGDRPTVEVWALATSSDGFTPAQQMVLDAFRQAVDAAGLSAPGGHPRTLFLDASELEVDGRQHLVLSVTVLSRLPEEVVNLGADAEAFYLTGNFADHELPAEGSDVRRDMSAEWLRQYHTIDDHFLLLVDVETIEARAVEIVAGL